MLIDRPIILDPAQSYTFRNYFELSAPPGEILADFGLTLQPDYLQLPQVEAPIASVHELQQRIRKTLLRTPLNNETARREAIVAPILFEVSELADAQVNIEYPIRVNQYLKGEIDYYVTRPNASVLIVEAKRDDLTCGFTQLVAELLAIYHGRFRAPVLYGAVTIGNVWQFCRLEVEAQRVFQDMQLYRAPEDLQDLMQALLGILSQNLLEA